MSWNPLVLATLGVFITSPLQAQWGTLKGRVTVTGDVPTVAALHAKGDPLVKDAFCRALEHADESLMIEAQTQGLANVFVFMKKAPSEIHPDLVDPKLEKLTFDQQGCRFVPHAMIVRTDQTVLLKNTDTTLHNVHTSPFFNTPINQAIAPSEQEGVPLVFRRRESVPVPVVCDIHPWMKAWMLVVDHPYAAQTNRSGEYTIDKVPVGEHTFRVWHERKGWLDKSLKVTITDDSATIVPIVVPVEELQAK